MLIHFGDTCALNVTAINRITVTPEDYKVVVKSDKWYKPNKSKIMTRFNVNLEYRDAGGNPKSQTVFYSEADNALKMKRVLLDQVKELELEHMTSTLDSAIRNS